MGSAPWLNATTKSEARVTESTIFRRTDSIGRRVSSLQPNFSSDQVIPISLFSDHWLLLFVLFEIDLFFFLLIAFLNCACSFDLSPSVEFFVYLVHEFEIHQFMRYSACLCINGLRFFSCYHESGYLCFILMCKSYLPYILCTNLTSRLSAFYYFLEVFLRMLDLWFFRHSNFWLRETCSKKKKKIVIVVDFYAWMLFLVTGAISIGCHWLSCSTVAIGRCSLLTFSMYWTLFWLLKKEWNLKSSMP